MELYFFDVRNKFLPFHPTVKKPMEIWEEPDTVRYRISLDPKPFVFRLHLRDAAGHETAVIQQNFITLGNEFHVTMRGMEKPYPSEPKNRSYKLRGTELHTDGDVPNLFYEIKDGERTAAQVQRVFSSKGACCQINLSDDTNAELVLAFIIAIEAAESSPN